MSKALGMIEFKTVSAGVTAADAMVKTAAVELVEAQAVCPGKYIALIKGDLSAVDAAVETAKVQYGEQLIDSFVLGNPHEGIFPPYTAPPMWRKSAPWGYWRPLTRQPS